MFNHILCILLVISLSACANDININPASMTEEQAADEMQTIIHSWICEARPLSDAEKERLNFLKRYVSYDRLVYQGQLDSQEVSFTKTPKLTYKGLSGKTYHYEEPCS